MGPGLGAGLFRFWCVGFDECFRLFSYLLDSRVHSRQVSVRVSLVAARWDF